MRFAPANAVAERWMMEHQFFRSIAPGGWPGVQGGCSGILSAFLPIVPFSAKQGIMIHVISITGSEETIGEDFPP
jgi:hypothetical protein